MTGFARRGQGCLGAQTRRRRLAPEDDAARAAAAIEQNRPRQLVHEARESFHGIVLGDFGAAHREIAKEKPVPLRRRRRLGLRQLVDRLAVGTQRDNGLEAARRDLGKFRLGLLRCDRYAGLDLSDVDHRKRPLRKRCRVGQAAQNILFAPEHALRA